MNWTEVFSQFRDGMLRVWRNLTASARINLVLTGLFTTILIVIVVVWSTRAEYVNLFTGLSPDDANAIQEQLEQRGIPYKFSPTGSTIKVPYNRATELRIDLAAEGIPASHGGVGFEIFDEVDLMTSKFVNDVNYERAIMGELQGMLNGLEFVANARVHITRAETTFFTGAAEPSKAAVTLAVRRMPTPHQVDGMLGLITSFGPANLTRDTITLMTSDGTVLHDPSSGDLEVGDSRLEMVRKYEQEFKRKAEQNLRDIGVASVVNVSFELDFSRKSEYEETLGKGQAVSRESDTLNTSSTERLPQGPAGALANIPDEDAVLPGGTQTTEDSELVTENFQIPSKIVNIEHVPGRVMAASASAYIEAKRVPGVDDEGNQTGEFTYEPYPEEELERFKVAIATSIGNGVTKDDVEVFGLDYPLTSEAFAVAAGDGALQTGSLWGRISNGAVNLLTDSQAWQYGIAGVLILGLLMFVRKQVRGLVHEEIVRETVEVSGSESRLTPEQERQQEIASEVASISQQQPDAVAALLRTWLMENEKS